MVEQMKKIGDILIASYNMIYTNTDLGQDVMVLDEGDHWQIAGDPYIVHGKKSLD